MCPVGNNDNCQACSANYEKMSVASGRKEARVAKRGRVGGAPRTWPRDVSSCLPLSPLTAMQLFKQTNAHCQH